MEGRAQINARGLEQIDRLHYDSSNNEAPYANNTTMCTIPDFTRFRHLVDVRDGFPNRRLRSYK
jgi:hypothetical protein